MTSPLAGTPDLPTLVGTYLLRCAVEGKSPETLRAYRETLGRVLDALQEDAAPTDPRLLRADHVLAYLARFQHLSHDTRHRYFREARCFFNWLRAAEYADNDHFRGLRNVRLPQKIVPPSATAVRRWGGARPSPHPDAARHGDPLRRARCARLGRL